MKTLLVACCLAAAPTAALAQSGASGSEIYRSSSRTTAMSGGRVSSTSYRLESELAAATPGPVLSSESYRIEMGTAWASHAVGQDGPAVFGFFDAQGAGGGGEVRTLVGAGFGPLGASLVSLDGAAASGVSVQSDSLIQLTTPFGLDALSNPKGAIDVTVESGADSYTAEGAFVYGPALTLDGPAQVGGSIRMTLYSSAGDFGFAFLGGVIPGVGATVSPLLGSLVTLENALMVLPPTLLAEDAQRVILPLPANPSLGGLSIRLQGGVLTSLAPLAGSFGNALSILIQP